MGILNHLAKENHKVEVNYNQKETQAWLVNYGRKEHHTL